MAVAALALVAGGGMLIARGRRKSLAEGLARARQYNSTLNGVPILDPWLTKASTLPGSELYKGCQGLLHDVDAMARVRVPTAQIDLPVHHGTGDEVLAKGAGHLYGTSLQVGGVGTPPRRAGARRCVTSPQPTG
ncbi:hypothetical protein HJ590_17200 [Naumannella sp. ID2617S]|nr:hypothetical protein [Naumannella sp. ID2617S]